jgi:hypothetical protein
MKFAMATATVGRGAVRERQRRDRAAAPLLRTRYPQLGSLQLDFHFSDKSDFLPSPQVTVFHPPARAYFCFACPYSDCDGEFDLTAPVGEAVTATEQRVGGQVNCAGTRHGGTACTLCLEYSITLHLA